MGMRVAEARGGRWADEEGRFAVVCCQATPAEPVEELGWDIGRGEFALVSGVGEEVGERE